ncbi:hypothetical protein ACH5RR_033887 [Cinchona calisaya]|uniref:Uncharacterized protein n=1 Tax=Cinchona calisaya TaxID=153742 RepID=A0ABD2YAJ2_9GENT
MKLLDVYEQFFGRKVSCLKIKFCESGIGFVWCDVRWWLARLYRCSGLCGCVIQLLTVLFLRQRLLLLIAVICQQLSDACVATHCEILFTATQHCSMYTRTSRQQ